MRGHYCKSTVSSEGPTDSDVTEDFACSRHCEYRVNCFDGNSDVEKMKLLLQARLLTSEKHSDRREIKKYLAFPQHESSKALPQGGTRYEGFTDMHCGYDFINERITNHPAINNLATGKTR
ncbi:hypothetical protein TNCV_1004951 [Trichonephila clavipes]|nr:hypothetical protein TNCV_1004951 [Trichonephila clavipes]